MWENVIAVVILLQVLARIETFKFYDENDHENFVREPASIWRENVIGLVILLQVLARMS